MIDNSDFSKSRRLEIGETVQLKDSAQEAVLLYDSEQERFFLNAGTEKIYRVQGIICY